MSAVLQRERRSTAGQRMTSLVGKALEDDQSFWGHDTWAEGEASDEGSFHESDEDSALARDEFDSDFDESESDHEQEEEDAGRQEEREIAREERKKKAKKGSYVDISKAGRDLLKSRKGKATKGKRVMGDGVNAGIVLNVPGAAGIRPPAVPVAAAPKPVKPEVSPLAATRPRRTTHLSKYSSRFRAARNDVKGSASDTADTESVASGSVGKRKATAAPSSQTGKKRKRQRYTQEQLILEAVQETEPENERWLLARKRVQDQAEKDREVASYPTMRGGKVIEKVSSRRGSLNLITFPEMDHVPEILSTQRRHHPKPPPRMKCVVTGEWARYRDPLTGLGYYDAKAFKELRRRHKAGERLDQRSKPLPAKKKAAAATNGSKTSSILARPSTTTTGSTMAPTAVQLQYPPPTSQAPPTPVSQDDPPVESKPPAVTTAAPSSSSLPTTTTKPASTSDPQSTVTQQPSTGAAPQQPTATAHAIAPSTSGTNGGPASARRASPRKKKPSAKVRETYAAAAPPSNDRNVPQIATDGGS